MHEKINYHAVFLLPPKMMKFFKPNIKFITEHAVDPDKRRYMLASEGAHHFLDIDHYGAYPYKDLPRNFNTAKLKFSEDSLKKYGIVPWWIEIMMNRLTKAFRDKDKENILKISTELGHYIADSHVPLHVCSNHNGQLTHQEGIHAFWESRIPELFAESDWDFFIGKAQYIQNIQEFIWARLLESAAAADTVLRYELEVSKIFKSDQKYAFENRKGKLIRQYSTAYASAFDEKLNHMIERRMRQSIFAVASFWLTAWVNAGQPDLDKFNKDSITDSNQKEYEIMNLLWKNGRKICRICD